MFAECEELRTKPLNKETVPWNIRGKVKVKIVTNIETIVNDPNFIPIITY